MHRGNPDVPGAVKARTVKVTINHAAGAGPKSVAAWYVDATRGDSLGTWNKMVRLTPMSVIYTQREFIPRESSRKSETVIRRDRCVAKLWRCGAGQARGAERRAAGAAHGSVRDQGGAGGARHERRQHDGGGADDGEQRGPPQLRVMHPPLAW
jgi:hypothetical protein